MKTLFAFAMLLLSAAGTTAQWVYPPTKTVDSSDTYWGMTSKDPYRWIENMKDKEVVDWFQAQADLSNNMLNKIVGRDRLVKEWMGLDKRKPANYSSTAHEGIGRGAG